MVIKEVTNAVERQRVTRLILEDLPDWFGIPEARESYIHESANHAFYAAYDADRPIGFIYLRETGKDTVELHVMGVLKEYHRRCIGKRLFEEAKEMAVAHGYSFLQVKTVQMRRYDEYDATNRFYISLGFKEFEVLPTLWGEENPCQIYVMSLK